MAKVKWPCKEKKKILGPCYRERVGGGGRVARNLNGTGTKPGCKSPVEQYPSPEGVKGAPTKNKRKVSGEKLRGAAKDSA